MACRRWWLSVCLFCSKHSNCLEIGFASMVIQTNNAFLFSLDFHTHTLFHGNHHARYRIALSAIFQLVELVFSGWTEGFKLNIRSTTMTRFHIARSLVHFVSNQWNHLRLTSNERSCGIESIRNFANQKNPKKSLKPTNDYTILARNNALIRVSRPERSSNKNNDEEKAR